MQDITNSIPIHAFIFNAFWNLSVVIQQVNLSNISYGAFCRNSYWKKNKKKLAVSECTSAKCQSCYILTRRVISPTKIMITCGDQRFAYFSILEESSSWRNLCDESFVNKSFLTKRNFFVLIEIVTNFALNVVKTKQVLLNICL